MVFEVESSADKVHHAIDAVLVASHHKHDARDVEIREIMLSKSLDVAGIAFHGRRGDAGARREGCDTEWSDPRVGWGGDTDVMPDRWVWMIDGVNARNSWHA